MSSSNVKSRLFSPTKAQLARNGVTQTKFRKKSSPPDSLSSSSMSGSKKSTQSSRRARVRPKSGTSQNQGSSRESSATNNDSRKSSPSEKPNLKVASTYSTSRKDLYKKQENSRSKRKNPSLVGTPDRERTILSNQLPSMSSTIESSTVGPMSIIAPDYPSVAPDYFSPNSTEESFDLRYSFSSLLHNKSINAGTSSKLNEKVQATEQEDLKQAADRPIRDGGNPKVNLNAKGQEKGNAEEQLQQTIPPPKPQRVPSHLFDGDEDDSQLPIKSTIPSDEASFVSALTFEYANLDSLPGVRQNEASVDPLLRQDSAEFPGSGRFRKSNRLEAVQEKVLDIQRENVSLKQVNLQLMMQLSIRQKKERQDKLNTLRLNAITAKVNNVQSENEALKNKNIALLLKLKKFKTQNEELQADRNPSCTGSCATPPRNILGTNKCNISQSSTVGSPGKKKTRDLVKMKKRVTESGRIGRTRSSTNSDTESKSVISSLGSPPSFNKENDRTKELTERIKTLELQNTNFIQQLQEADLLRAEESKKIAALNAKVKEKSLLADSLENHIKKLNEEMVALRQVHEADKSGLQIAYNELKTEATQIVGWLKNQLAGRQLDNDDDDDLSTGIDRSEGIVRAQDDDDLESLTESEKKSLRNEIEEERKRWIEDLGESASRLSAMTPVDRESTGVELNIIRGSTGSVDGSTLTGSLSPL